MEHTPTPWKLGDLPIVEYNPRSHNSLFHERGGSIMAGDDADIVVGGCQDEQGGAVGVLRNADAEFIVRAVNCHDELVAACEAGLATINWFRAHSRGVDMINGSEIVKQLRAAIKNAKGEDI